ncbi:MAG: ABC transporter ATP-binding protein [Sphaerochaetaceae bacterium]|nr:ABC transporter ATP-binding protein [Sphaerochaetaceae bacterium]
MTTMLKIQDVVIKFGGLCAVNEVSMDVEPNSITALIGPNGAGKTTLFNIISGVLTPLSGDILFAGNSIKGFRPYMINKTGIARTYQNINLFSNISVIENVMIGQHCRRDSNLFQTLFRTNYQVREEREIREKAMEILDFLGLAEFSDFTAKSLSYGNQRKLEIARALASTPQVLLLDEPAAGMNTTEKGELMDLIRQIQDTGVTILIVEHDMKLVMSLAEQVHVMNYGRKIAQGKPYEVQNNKDVIEAYLGTE